MRIVAGLAKRVNLVAPQGTHTRPTSDMAKESLFNIISANVRGARVLDLFCGSGAIGLEALSRGAAHAVFVDNAQPAINATLQNIEKTRLAHLAELVKLPAAQAISKLSATGRAFDIIFMDPPYETELLKEMLCLIAKANILAKDGMIIAETDTKLNVANPVDLPAELCLTDTRVYGRACFLFYEYEQVGE